MGIRAWLRWVVVKKHTNKNRTVPQAIPVDGVDAFKMSDSLKLVFVGPAAAVVILALLTLCV